METENLNYLKKYQLVTEKTFVLLHFGHTHKHVHTQKSYKLQKLSLPFEENQQILLDLDQCLSLQNQQVTHSVWNI